MRDNIDDNEKEKMKKEFNKRKKEKRDKIDDNEKEQLKKYKKKGKKVKACVRYFQSNFYFSQNNSHLKTMKNLFHLKSSSHSRDIQIFMIFSFPFHTFHIQKDKWKWNNL